MSKSENSKPSVLPFLLVGGIGAGLVIGTLFGGQGEPVEPKNRVVVPVQAPLIETPLIASEPEANSNVTVTPAVVESAVELPAAAAPVVKAVTAPEPSKESNQKEPVKPAVQSKKKAESKQTMREATPKKEQAAAPKNPTPKPAAVVSSKAERVKTEKIAEVEKFYKVGVSSTPAPVTTTPEPSSKAKPATTAEILETVGQKAFVRLSTGQTLVAGVGDKVPGMGRIKSIENGKISFE